jgi:hypothetical protein
MYLRNFLIIAFIGLNFIAIAQQRVLPLYNDLSVDSIFTPKPYATKLDYDVVSGHLFYAVITGEIYEIFLNELGGATDSLRFTAADHGITCLQGLCFRDGVLYLSGNNWTSTVGFGYVVKGTSSFNGQRTWEIMVSTDPYPTASPTGDHGFTGVAVNPSGSHVYVSSGVRTHLGELDDNNGAWPNTREVPLTSRIFRFPINSLNVLLLNDSASLVNSPYLFASGTRNAYDMAWDSKDTLFAIDNSGERDDPEELNWLRQGRNYGFPWRMGGNDNPIQYPNYDYHTDPLVNPNGSGVAAGWFNYTSGFPPIPNNVNWMEPIRNLGSAGDFYRDAISGGVLQASQNGTYVSSFTAHRSPLGLVFDADSSLSFPYKGDGFVLSFMPGGDSLGFSPISPWGSPCPFVDPSRDLIQMKLEYNASIDNYEMVTRSVVSGFYLPVDAEFIGNNLYVIERGGDLWKINFPKDPIIPENSILIYPNPTESYFKVVFGMDKALDYLKVYDLNGKELYYQTNSLSNSISVDVSQWSCGTYIVRAEFTNGLFVNQKLIIN